MGCPRAGGNRAVPLLPARGNLSVRSAKGIVNMNAHMSSVLLSMSANYLLLLVFARKLSFYILSYVTSK